MGVKFSNNISSESTQQIHPPKFMHTSREGLHQWCALLDHVTPTATTGSCHPPTKAERFC